MKGDERLDDLDRKALLDSDEDIIKKHFRYLWQRRSIFYLASYLGYFCIILFFIRAILGFESIASSLVLFFMGVFFIVIGRMTLSQNSPTIIGHILISFGAILLPIRIMATGGLNGTGLIFLPMINAFLPYMVGKKWGVVYGGISFLWLYILHNSVLSKVFTSNAVYSDNIHFAFLFMAMFIGSGLAFVIENTKDRLIKGLITNRDQYRDAQKNQIKLEKEKAVNALISSYNHEINNPLFIALGNLKRYKKNPDPKNLDRLESSLERIRSITKKIEETAKRDIYDESK
ncbi:MAG: hypothetical protein GY909_09810 [Oligoflexia bacterium]|nr:hypothetical protein [Oligoflexia bacterium]